MGTTLERHDAIFEGAVREAGGAVFKHTGDGIVARFESAAAAISAAVQALRALAEQDGGTVGTLTARIGVHAGEAEQRAGDWFGPALNRTARLMGVGHGGQILVSGAVEGLARDALPADVQLLDLGLHQLRDLARPEHVFQVSARNLREAFPPLWSLDAFKGNLP